MAESLRSWTVSNSRMASSFCGVAARRIRTRGSLVNQINRFIGHVAIRNVPLSHFSCGLESVVSDFKAMMFLEPLSQSTEDLDTLSTVDSRTVIG
jgi:hypothetical protein